MRLESQQSRRRRAEITVLVDVAACNESCRETGVTAEHRLRLVVYQDVPGLWVGRGIEHDLTAEGRGIGETVRALLRMIQAHAAFDTRHDRTQLSAFRPAPQSCW